MKNKVLVISYDYYPDNSPNTYRWHNILKIWASAGCEVFVVTFKKSGSPDYENCDGIHIHRTSRSLIEKLKSIIMKREQHKNSIAKEGSIVKNSVLKKVYNNTFKRLYFPDFAFLWRRFGEALAQKLILKHEINNVITVSWPFTDHVIGCRLRKKINFNWIADTIDPFYLSNAVNNSFLYSSLNYKYEKKILKHADVVTVLTEKLQSKYKDLFPAITEKLVVNHNIFVPYYYKKVSFSKKSNNLKLVFVGTLSPITRSPELLLKIFNELVYLFEDSSNLQLHLYGNLSSCSGYFAKYEHLIDRNLFLHSFVSRDKIAEILFEADVVINIGNKNLYQEPSKIVEYIFLKKKIINICSIYEDTSKEVLADYPLHINLFPEDWNDHQKLVDTLNFMSNSMNIDDDLVNSIITKYLLTSVEKKYFNLLKFNNE